MLLFSSLAFPRFQICKANAKLSPSGRSLVNKQTHQCTLGQMKKEAEAPPLASYAAVSEESCHSLVKAVAILYEVVQLLSGILNHVLVELHAMVHAKGTYGRKQGDGN